MLKRDNSSTRTKNFESIRWKLRSERIFENWSILISFLLIASASGHRSGRGWCQNVRNIMLHEHEQFEVNRLNSFQVIKDLNSAYGIFNVKLKWPPNPQFWSDPDKICHGPVYYHPRSPGKNLRSIGGELTEIWFLNKKFRQWWEIGLFAIFDNFLCENYSTEFHQKLIRSAWFTNIYQ